MKPARVSFLLLQFSVLLIESLWGSQVNFLPEQHENFKLPAKTKCGNKEYDNAYDPMTRIVGGFNALIGQFPWMARIKQKKLDGGDHFNCGGSLISAYYVVTAAHCTLTSHPLTNDIFPIPITHVRLGEWDATSDIDCQFCYCAPPVQDIPIVEVLPHEAFDWNKKGKNDIALLRLETSPQLSYFVQPVCLPFGAAMTKDFTYEATLTAGWGDTRWEEDGGNYPATVLHGLEQTVVSRSQCKRAWGPKIPEDDFMDGQICVGGRIGESACFGDSGGPLMWTGSIDPNVSYRAYLLGVASVAMGGCAESNVPQIFTKTTFYMKWILDNMRE